MGCGCAQVNKDALKRLKDNFIPVHKKPMNSSKYAKELRLWYDHGCGDVVHWVHLLKLYQKRGYKVLCHYEHNKQFIFDCAGIPYAPMENVNYHPWLYPGDFNGPTIHGDYTGNKIFFNINTAPLPHLGKATDIWEELLTVNLEGTGDELVTPQVHKEVEEWTKALPHPLVLIHSNGTNWPQSKDIPDGTQRDLYDILLGHGYGVIQLDWDNRSQTTKHKNFRHLIKDFSHLSLMQLYALMGKADCLVSIDSGVGHFASLCTLPNVFVCHHHYPSCITLPRAKNVYMTRDADSYKPVNQSRRDRWNIVEYPGGMPSASDIATQVQRVLAGPRYFTSKDTIGRDVMMQQWVSWCKGRGTSTGQNDRDTTFDFLLREMNERFQAPVIVETGCVRSREDWSGAGNSTYLLGAWIDGKGGKFISVDNSEENCNFAREYCSQWPVDIVCSDSVEWLKKTEERIDLAFLDSLDCDVQGHQEHGLEEVKAVLPKLTEKALIVIDDTVHTDGRWIGKGGRAVPFLLENGWNLLCSGYQAILSRA